jgi:hypothetical protein
MSVFKISNFSGSKTCGHPSGAQWRLRSGGVCVSAAKAVALFPVFIFIFLLPFTLSGCFYSQAAIISSSTSLVASTTNVSFGTITIGQTANSKVSVTNNTSAPIEIAELSTTGDSFSAIASGALPASVAPGADYNFTVLFAPSAAGTATGTLTISSGLSKTPVLIDLTGTGANKQPFSYSGSSLAGTVVSADATPVANQFFGMTIFHLASATPSSDPLTPFPAFQVSSFRFWDVAYWANLEPSEGVFNWTKMDGALNAAQQNGVNDFIFTFGHTPQWAAVSPNDTCYGIGIGTCSVPDMQAFDDFVTHVVQRYCGRVQYYEPWNEPNGPGYWDGNNSQLMSIAQDVYRIAKDPANCGCTNGKCSPNGGANPNKVLLPPISRITAANIEWLDSFLSTAGAQYPYADVATFHGYDVIGPEDVALELPQLRSTLAQHGLGNLELWDTEASWGQNESPDTETQASWLMRDYVLHAVSGVSRFVWYAYDSCDYGTLWVTKECSGLIAGAQQGLNAPGDAYAVIQHWLTGASVTQCLSYQNGLWACELQRSGDYDAWMLWSSTGTEIAVPLPNGSELTMYRDWQDNAQQLPTQLSVGQMPVLLENHDL